MVDLVGVAGRYFLSRKTLELRPGPSHVIYGMRWCGRGDGERKLNPQKKVRKGGTHVR